MIVRLLIIFFLVGIATAATAERRVAFLVGNSDYEAVAALKNPRADVKLVEAALKQVSFEVKTAVDLTRSEIARQLSAFLEETEGADLSLFYFAGHGMQFDNRNYLLGTDADLTSSLDVEDDGLELGRVLNLMSRKTKAALVFIDACRDNPLATRFYTENYSATRAVATRGLARLPNSFMGTMVTFSASPGQVAFDGEGTHSPFADALARHLPTENIEILSLTKRIIGDVRNATDGKQSPVVTNDLTREIFLREAALKPNHSDRSQLLFTEQTLFDAADKLDTLHSWALYFEKFPNGQLSGAALQRENAVLLREAGHLANGWTYVDKPFEFTASLANRLEALLGLKNVDILAAQALLRRAGFDPGGLDGALGARSRAAIKSFQEAKGLPANGMLTRATTAALGLNLELYAKRPGFSSLRLKHLDFEAARLLEMPDRFLAFLEKNNFKNLVYGFRNDRAYAVAISHADYSFFYDFVSKNKAPEKNPPAYVAEINDNSENRYIYDLTRHDQAFWRLNSNRTTYFGPRIGLFQIKSSREPARDWYWQSGGNASYRAWGRDEPNNYNGSEDFVQLAIPYRGQRPTPDLARGASWNDMPFTRTATVFEIELGE